MPGLLGFIAFTASVAALVLVGRRFWRDWKIAAQAQREVAAGLDAALERIIREGRRRG